MPSKATRWSWWRAGWTGCKPSTSHYAGNTASRSWWSRPPVVRAGIRALQAGRISVVPGWANKALVILTWATPRWLQQAFLSRAMNG
jgi:short-subunit dehydrogenase